MTKPTPQEFVAAYEPEYLMEDWEAEFEDANDRGPTEEEYDAQYNLFQSGNFEIVEQYPTIEDDVFIVRDKRTGQTYKTEVWRDSWGGSFEYHECEFTEVVQKEVTELKWVAL